MGITTPLIFGLSPLLLSIATPSVLATCCSRISYVSTALLKLGLGSVLILLFPSLNPTIISLPVISKFSPLLFQAQGSEMIHILLLQ